MAEPLKDEVGVQGSKRRVSEQRGMSGPRIVVEIIDTHPQLRAHRIEVDIADEFEKVGLLLNQRAFEAVLEQVTAAAMEAVETRGIGAEPALREAGERKVAGADQCVGMRAKA